MNILELHKKLMTHMLGGVDLKRFAAIRARHMDDTPATGYSKYLDMPYWMGKALDVALDLGLHQRRGMNILDIGTKAGYFPYVCSRLGHTVQSIEAPGNAMFDSMHRLLGVQRISHTIESYRPLPKTNGNFDLITAMSICFNGHKSDNLWKRHEWKSLLMDIAQHHLGPNGSVFLHFTPENDGTFMPEDVEQLFTDLGACIEGERILFEDKTVLRKLRRAA